MSRATKLQIVMLLIAAAAIGALLLNARPAQADTPDDECTLFYNHSGSIPGSYDYGHGHEWDDGQIIDTFEVKGGQNAGAPSNGGTWDFVWKCKFPPPTTTTTEPPTTTTTEPPTTTTTEPPTTTTTEPPTTTTTEPPTTTTTVPETTTTIEDTTTTTDPVTTTTEDTTTTTDPATTTQPTLPVTGPGDDVIRIGWIAAAIIVTGIAILGAADLIGRWRLRRQH